MRVPNPVKLQLIPYRSLPEVWRTLVELIKIKESIALPSPPFFLANLSSLPLVDGSTLHEMGTRVTSAFGRPVWLGRLPPQSGLSLGVIVLSSFR